MTYCLEVHVNYNIDLQKDLAEGEALSVSQKTLDGGVSSLENYVVKDRVENPVNSEHVHFSLGKHNIL